MSARTSLQAIKHTHRRETTGVSERYREQTTDYVTQNRNILEDHETKSCSYRPCLLLLSFFSKIQSRPFFTDLPFMFLNRHLQRDKMWPSSLFKIYFVSNCIQTLNSHSEVHAWTWTWLWKAGKAAWWAFESGGTTTFCGFLLVFWLHQSRYGWTCVNHGQDTLTIQTSVKATEQKLNCFIVKIIYRANIQLLIR